MESPNNTNKNYSHVLQKVGVLRNFSVAKVVNSKEIADLKQLVKAVAKDEAEYDKLFAEEMTQIANMHNPKSPIPGILYIEDRAAIIKGLENTAKEYATKMKTSKITKKQLCFLVSAIIKELGLTHDDFLKLNDDDDD